MNFRITILLLVVFFFSCKTDNDSEKIEILNDTLGNKKNVSEKDTFDYSNERCNCTDDSSATIKENLYEPSFKSTEQELTNFIKSNIEIPLWIKENKISGKVYVKVFISKSGNLIKAKVIKGISECSDCSKIALSVVNKMTLWNAGYIIDKNNKKHPEEMSTIIEIEIN